MLEELILYQKMYDLNKYSFFNLFIAVERIYRRSILHKIVVARFIGLCSIN